MGVTNAIEPAPQGVFCHHKKESVLLIYTKVKLDLLKIITPKIETSFLKKAYN
jgi:hypothetical protein